MLSGAVNLSSSFILCCCKGNTFSLVRYSYLSLLHDVYADNYAAALLMSCCIFSTLIFASVVMITLYTSSNRLVQKCRTLSDERVVSMTKNENGSAVYFQ